MTEVGEATVKEEAATAPKSTALAALNPVPVMVTGVAPAGKPAFGLSAVTVGGAS